MKILKKTVALFAVLSLFLAAPFGPGAIAAPAGAVDTFRSFYQYYTTFMAAEAEDTLYFMDGLGHMIYYVDKATGISGPLCGKPQCPHNGETCNAYLADFTARMFVDGGRLYTVSDYADPWSGKGIPVYSMALDGTDRRTEAYLDSSYLPESLEWPYFLLHDGVMYYGGEGRLIENGEEKCYNHICAFPMDGKTEPYDILWEEVPADSMDFSMQFYGDKLYFITDEFNGETNSLRDFRLRCYDVRSGEMQTLYEDLASPLSKATELWVTEDGVYFDRRVNDPVVDVRIFFYDFQTRTCEYQFSSGIEGPRVGLADDLVTGVGTKYNENGAFDLRVVLKDLTGSVLVDDTYTLQLDPQYWDQYWGIDFLGRDETQAYYGLAGGAGSAPNVIIAVALDGSGARVLCEQEA